jgi:hypothetical protein
MAKLLKLPAVAIPGDLDPLAAVVLQSLPKISDDQRAGVGCGDHAVALDIRIRVNGILKVGPDTDVSQVNALKPWQLCKLLANRVPPKVLDDILGEAIQAVKDGRDICDDGDDIKDRVVDRFLMAGCACTIVRKGSCKLVGELAVEVVE